MYEIGVYTGTFNPLHFWHLIVADFAREEHGLKEVLFVPNGNPVHKKGVVDKELRFDMVEAGIKNNPFFKASRIEVDREGPSYTVDTLRALKAQYGHDARLNLIVGLDNVKADASLPITRWKEAGELFKLCRVLVGPRNFEAAEKEKVKAFLPQGADFAIINSPSSNISSSFIRERIAEGRSVRHLLPAEVLEIVLRERLYARPV